MKINMTLSHNSPSIETIHVLHVDDEQEFLLIAARMIMSIDPNLRIESTTSPQEALEMIKKKGYDCIVSDYRMPVSDGIKFAERVRKESNIPFILYTGQGSEEVAERAFGAGIDDYLRKEMEPSHYEVLVKRIRVAVGAYRSEKSLHEREQELSGMIENALDGIFRIEMAHGVTRCNPAFLKFFGYTLEEFQSMGMHMLELIHDEDKAQLMSELDDLSSRRLDKYSSLNRWRTKRGNVIWLESSISSIVENDEFIGVEIIARDVTEQKQIEEERVRAEEKWRSLAELAPDGIFTVNLKGVITWVNESFLRLTGYPREEIIGKHFTKLKVVRARDIPRYLKMFAQTLQGTLPAPIEYSYVHRDGSTRWAVGNFRVLKAGANKEILGFLTDISRYKVLEARLLDHSDLLEREGS